MDYDILILGAGPGGYVAAIRAAQLGANVALIEERRLGGTCLNRGCIPTKALVESVRVLALARSAGDYGVQCSGVKPDFAAMTERKNRIVDRLCKGVGMLVKKNKIDVVQGRGKLTDRHAVEVSSPSETRKLTAHNIILATGSAPLELKEMPFDGNVVLSSDHALELDKIPESILIVGGGYIGSEWAGIFAGLGAKVTVVELMPQLLPRSDADLARELFKALKKQGIAIHLETSVDAVTVKGNAAACALSNGKKLRAEKVLVSVGRAVNSAGTGIENAGVETDRGAILIDEHCRTNVPNIYAIGDVTAKLMLAHIASRQGIVAAEHIRGRDTKMDYRVVPACVFTHPEIASVGMTRPECAEQGINVKESRFPFMALGKALAMGDTAGWVKIVADTDTGEVLGVHIIGLHASDLIAEAALAMSMEATVEEIVHAIHAHPTLPEAISGSAEAWLDQGIHT